VASVKERLGETEESLKQAREEKDREVKDLLDRLVNVENELAKERDEMQEVLQAKQRIIDAQEKRIKSLDSTNSRLVATLNQLKSNHDRDRPKQRENRDKKVHLEERSDEYV
jgi:RAS protein activator-like 2